MAAARSKPIAVDEAVVSAKSLLTQTQVSQLKPIVAALKQYDKRIEQLLFDFTDGNLFRRLPGVDVILAAKLLAAIGRSTLADYLRFLYIAKGSLCELEYYIHLAKRLGYLAQDDHRILNALQDETARILTGFIRFKQQEANTASS